MVSFSTLFYQKRDITTRLCFFPNVCLSAKTVSYQNMYLFLFHFILYTSFFRLDDRPPIYLLKKRKILSDILFKHVEILLSGNKNISSFSFTEKAKRTDNILSINGLSIYVRIDKKTTKFVYLI